MIQFEVPRRILNNFASVWTKLFREILKIKFSQNSLSIFQSKYTHIYRLIVPVQKIARRDVSFQKVFLKLFFTGNRLQDSGNRLHNYILRSYDFSINFFKSVHW